MQIRDGKNSDPEWKKFESGMEKNSDPQHWTEEFEENG